MAILRIERGDLEGLDVLAVEALVLFAWKERGQPQDVTGMVDWRMSGRLARLLMAGRFEGDESEALLMPTQGRLRPQRIFWLGLGERRQAELVDFGPSVKRLFDAGARRIAVAAPDGEPEASLSLLCRFVAAAKDRFHEVAILETGDRVSARKEPLEKAAAAAKLTVGR